MSTFIFVEVLAYAAAAMGVIVLLYLGFLLSRRKSVVQGLSALIGEEKARQCLEDGSFRSGHARTLGALFVLLAIAVTFGIAQGIRHA
jgi:hypothetical protein